VRVVDHGAIDGATDGASDGIIMQRDVGRTCNVGCTEICGVSPTKNHREKTVDRWVINSEEDYGSSLSMAQEVIL